MKINITPLFLTISNPPEDVVSIVDGFDLNRMRMEGNKMRVYGNSSELYKMLLEISKTYDVDLV